MSLNITEKVAVYCRVSSEDQAERGTIEVQKDFAQNYIKLYNLSLYDFYCDDGVSGTIPLKDRSEGSRLLHDATKRLFDTVLFYKLDRIGRKTTVILEAIQSLTSQGINVRSMTEPLDTNTPTGKFLITTLSGIAELDRDSTLMRMHSGALVAAKKGKWLGGIVPFGYLTDKEGYLVVSSGKIPGLEFSEEEIVKIIFHMCGNEGRSSKEIADYINALGVPTRFVFSEDVQRKKYPGKRLQNNSALWSPSRILTMIHSTIYKGYRTYGLRATLKDYDPIPQTVPAIVDEKLWTKANKAIQSRIIISKKQRQGNYLLQGYIFCGQCGHTYCGTYNRLKGDTATYYYRCNGRDAYGKDRRCTLSASINAEWVEHIVLDYCAMLLREHTFMEETAKPAVKDNTVSLERASLDRAIKNLANEKDSILSLYRKSLITLDDLTRQLEKIKQEQKSMEERKANLERPTPQEVISQNRQTSAEFFKKFRQIFPKDYDLSNLSFQTQREIVKLFIERVTVFTERYGSDSYYLSFRIEILDKFGNTSAVSTASTLRLKNQEDKAGKSINTVGGKLRTLRLERGYTQKQVSEATGLTLATINAFENHRRPSSNAAFQHESLTRLANFYSIPYEALSIYNVTEIASDERKLFAQVRDVKGLTSDELCREMGITRPTFRKYLKGKGSATSRKKISDYLSSARKWLETLMQSR